MLQLLTISPQDQITGGARRSSDRAPRQARVMCHGVFDVVHPGHVRHLLYAKSKADI